MTTPPRKRAPRKTSPSKADNTPKPAAADPAGPQPDLDVIAPAPLPALRIAGIEAVPIAPLSARHLLALLNLLVAAYGGNLTAVRIQESDLERFLSQFGGLLLPAVLAQPNQAIEWLASVVAPVDSNERQALWVAMTADPDPLNLLDVLDAVITANGPHLRDIVGKLRALLSRAGMTMAAANRARTSTT